MERMKWKGTADPASSISSSAVKSTSSSCSSTWAKGKGKRTFTVSVGTARWCAQPAARRTTKRDGSSSPYLIRAYTLRAALAAREFDEEPPPGDGESGMLRAAPWCSVRPGGARAAALRQRTEEGAARDMRCSDIPRHARARTDDVDDAAC